MQRTAFLKGCAAALLATGIKSAAARTPAAGRGILVRAGHDRFDSPQSLFDGDIFATKVSGRDNGGALYLFESSRARLGGPPLHYHYDQDEWWYILEGEFLFQVGDEQFTAAAGDSVFGPRRVPHAFAKLHDGTARMLLGYTPAGRMEEYFGAVSRGAQKGFTQAQREAFAREHGFEFVGPALTFDKFVG